MTLYFAYGANMDPEQMAARCPGAERLGTAVLDGHAFGIAAGGFGTALPARGRSIHGVLWFLTPADEAVLDRFEEVDRGFYRKREAGVVTPDGSTVQAMIYHAADPSPGRPNPGYLERVVEVSESLGFPPEYVAGLRRLVIEIRP
jgi:AIG2 family protein